MENERTGLIGTRPHGKGHLEHSNETHHGMGHLAKQKGRAHVHDNSNEHHMKHPNAGSGAKVSVIMGDMAKLEHITKSRANTEIDTEKEGGKAEVATKDSQKSEIASKSGSKKATEIITGSQKHASSKSSRKDRHSVIYS